MVDANDFVVRDNNDVLRASFNCETDYSNTLNEEIVIKICGDTANDSLYLDLGKKNKLTSINYTGGEAGGGGDGMDELIAEIKGLRADLSSGKIGVNMDGQKVTSKITSVVDKGSKNSYAK